MVSFILVPGAGGMASYWHRVVPLIRAAGHEAIAIDLPGDDRHAGLAAYADIIIRAIARTKRRCSRRSLASGLHRAACLRACARADARVRQCDDPQARRDSWRMVEGATGAVEAREQLRARGGYAADFDQATYFLHDVPQDVLRTGPQQPREEAEIVFGEPCQFDRWPDIAVRALAGRDDRFFPIEFQRRVARERLGKEVDESLAVVSSRCRIPEGLPRAPSSV